MFLPSRIPFAFAVAAGSGLTRRADETAIATRANDLALGVADHVVRVPETPTLMQPLVSTVPLQVFACELATVKGHDVDQPRNLAKSVTVE